jgi:hypothetical protein
MSRGEKHSTRPHALGIHDHAFASETNDRHLLAYCMTSGLVGTSAATVAGLAAAGTARIVVWVAVLGSISVFAGLAYGLRPTWTVRLARQAVRRARQHA